MGFFANAVKNLKKSMISLQMPGFPHVFWFWTATSSRTTANTITTRVNAT